MENHTPQNTEMTEDTKSIITVLVLLTFAPVGIIMMWVWTKWKFWVKSLITGCACLPFLIIPLMIAFAVLMGGTDTESSSTGGVQLNENSNSSGIVSMSQTTSSGSVNVYSDTKGGYTVSYSSNDLKNCNEKGYSPDLILFRAPHNCEPGDVPYLIRVSTDKIRDEFFANANQLTEEDIVLDGVKGTKYTYTFSETDGPLMDIGQQVVVLIERPVKDSLGNNPVVVIEMYGDDPQEQVIFNKFLGSFKWQGKE